MWGATAGRRRAQDTNNENNGQKTLEEVWGATGGTNAGAAAGRQSQHAQGDDGIFEKEDTETKKDAAPSQKRTYVASTSASTSAAVKAKRVCDRQEQPGTSSKAAGTGARVVQNLPMSTQKKEGRWFVRLGKKSDENGRFFLGAALPTEEAAVACADAVARKTGCAIEKRRVNASETFPTEHWLEDIIKNKKRASQRARLLIVLEHMEHDRGSFTQLLSLAVKADQKNAASTPQRSPTEKSLRLCGVDFREFKSQIRSLVSHNNAKLTFGGKATLKAAGYDVEAVRESAKKLFAVQGKDSTRCLVPLEPNDVKNLLLTPPHTKQLVIQSGALCGEREGVDALLKAWFANNPYVGINRSTCGTRAEFQWAAPFCGGDQGNPYSSNPDRVYGWATDERLAVARREAFVTLYRAHNPEAFRNVVHNAVGVYGEGALTTEEQDAATNHIIDNYGDSVVDDLEELNVVQNDGDENATLETPSPAFIDVDATRHLRTQLASFVDHTGAFSKSIHCQVIGTYRPHSEAQCACDCRGLMYVFINPLVISDADGHDVFATKSGITNGFGYHSSMTAWCRSLETMLGVPSLRFALLRAASKRPFFEGKTRVRVYTVASNIHEHEFEALNYAARAASLKTLVPKRTEMFQLGSVKAEAVKRNDEYVAAFDAYARKNSAISLVAEVEIPPRGAFKRGAPSWKDKIVLNGIVASARIANERGELVPFTQSG